MKPLKSENKKIKKCPKCKGFYGQYDEAIPAGRLPFGRDYILVTRTSDGHMLINYVCEHCRKEKIGK